jgi:DNA-binding response OmpR family regulator
MVQTGRKILVVDDDPWIAKMLEFVATDAGHTAVVCKDGVDALEKFAELMPDLVLLDVVLPLPGTRKGDSER